MSSYYKAFKIGTERPLGPTKEEYDAYIQPTKINKKTGLLREKEVREMTVKEMAYHSYMMKYWVRNIEPSLSERT